MAVYSKLLLSTGGGVVSSQQQAEQVKNTATILIGLGGTGIDCIRTIKTQVYKRLKPDDEEAVVPGYSHIQFLGVDTNPDTKGSILTPNQKDEVKNATFSMPLEDTEFSSIANQNLEKALENVDALKKKEELSWLEYEKIGKVNFTDAGACGKRQIGRAMFMMKAREFETKVKSKINAAKSGLTNPRVIIHIFAGLSGGTGSGCFLDVCYMLRSIVKEDGGSILGYFFLPDVNLSKIPLTDVGTRDYIPKNGYAAMQELDYCMRLPKNGDSFVQIYPDHRSIKWDGPPVNMCHLLCATDKNNNVIPNAYDYALNVTAEYVMEFVTEYDQKASQEKFSIVEQLSNFETKNGEADSKKVIGSSMNYCVIGGSCAYVPFKEINTYLASELFDRFSVINENSPGKTDVDGFATTVLAKGSETVAEIYDALYREVCEPGDGESAVGEYSAFTEDWKYVRDYGNSDMLLHYTNQTAAQLGTVERNAKSMAGKNEHSLLVKVQAQLESILRDIQRGPMFAYRILCKSKNHNFLDIIDGLIEGNGVRWNDEAGQRELRQKDYNNAKSDFENRRLRKPLDSDKKRFQDYEYYLMLLEQHKGLLGVYEKLDSVLREFRKQIVDITASYYIKLERVMNTLIATFKENQDALKSQTLLAGNGTFAIPMVEIKELEDSLNAKVEQVNVVGMFDEFMTVLLNKKEEWKQEDENKISHLVTDFFVKQAFPESASNTITGYLTDKYEKKYGTKISNDQLAQYIYTEWMKSLTEKASPLFYFDDNIWSDEQTSKLAFLSFPAISAPIKTAAQQMYQQDDLWKWKASKLEDRIFALCSACGLPLGSYNNCEKYERLFFSAKEAGRHYYEGKPVRGMKFNDWKKLPSIRPQSVINTADIPVDLANLVEEARQLYDKAYEFGIIDNMNGGIYEASKKDIAEIETLCGNCEKLLNNINKPQDIPALEQAVSALEQAVAHVAMVQTEYSLPTDGYRKDAETIYSIQKDHFVSSPAFHAMVKQQIEVIGNVKEVSQIVGTATKKIAEVRRKVMADYCDAVFSGVISLEGQMVIYHQNTSGEVKDMALSEYGDEFAYKLIPLYQGFISYQAMKDSIKNEIKEIANERMSKEAPEIKTAGEQLKEYLSDKQITRWTQSAEEDYAQESQIIIAFLDELKQRFQKHCNRLDL